MYFSGNPGDEDKSNSLQNLRFNFLLAEIGPTWKRFTRQFNIEDNKIVEITKSSCWYLDGCYNVFHELKRRYGSVKWKPIEMALQELELVNTISKYQEKFS